MAIKKVTDNFLEGLEERFQKEMLRVRREISVYENRHASNKLNKNPQAAPQFSR